MQMKSTEMSLYNPNLNMFVSHPKVDVLYNPNLDDSFYVIQTVGCSSGYYCLDTCKHNAWEKIRKSTNKQMLDSKVLGDSLPTDSTELCLLSAVYFSAEHGYSGKTRCFFY